MKVIVLNCGSSSIKYKLFDTDGPKVIAKGLVEKIGMNGSRIRHEKQNGKEDVVFEGEILDHQSGIEYMLGILISKKHGCIKSFNEIDAIGHRVVHGGEKFNSSVLITSEVIAMLEECISLAPLHNPPNLSGIYAMQNLLPHVPQVGAFDTAFHQTMPDYAYLYALPYSLYKQHGIRRYGFHGTSHKFVMQQACSFLGLAPEQSRIITCHMGNGGSITAILNGQSVDTSMGMTPVEGLVMGTRCGDLDPGILPYLMQREELNINTANTLVNKHSGLIGISGVSSDMREVTAAAKNGNERASLALNMFYYRIRKYIGAYTAVMGGVDVIVFTGGIGENSTLARAEIMKDFEFLGVDFDPAKNEQARGETALISTPSSRVKVLVVPTNEELVIARDTAAIVRQLNKS
jgi:acetate kinase